MKKYVSPKIVMHTFETEAALLSASDPKLEMEWYGGVGSSGKDASTDYEILSKEHSNDNTLWDDE